MGLFQGTEDVVSFNFRLCTGLVWTFNILVHERNVICRSVARAGSSRC